MPRTAASRAAAPGGRLTASCGDAPRRHRNASDAVARPTLCLSIRPRSLTQGCAPCAPMKDTEGVGGDSRRSELQEPKITDFVVGKALGSASAAAPVVM